MFEKVVKTTLFEMLVLTFYGALGAAGIVLFFHITALVFSMGLVEEYNPFLLMIGMTILAFPGGLWGLVTGLWAGVFMALANDKSGKNHRLGPCFIIGGLLVAVPLFLTVLSTSLVFFLTTGYGGPLSALETALPWTICGTTFGSVFAVIWGIVRTMRNDDADITRNGILKHLTQNLRYVLCTAAVFIFLATLLCSGYSGVFDTEKIGAVEEFDLTDGVRVTVERLPTPPFRYIDSACVSRDGKSFAYFSAEENHLLAWCAFQANHYAICVNGKVGVKGTYPFGATLMQPPFSPPKVCFDKDGNWITVLHDEAYINGKNFNLDGYDQTCEAIVRDDGSLMYHVRKGENYYLVVDDITYQIPVKFLGGLLFSQDNRLLYLEGGGWHVVIQEAFLFSDQVESRDKIVHPMTISPETFFGSINFPGYLELWSKFYHQIIINVPTASNQDVVFYSYIENYSRKINHGQHSLIMRFPFQEQAPNPSEKSELDDLVRIKEMKFFTLFEIPSQKIIMDFYGGRIVRQKDMRWESKKTAAESVSFYAWRGIRFYRIRLWKPEA